MAGAVFDALSGPVRRRILELLGDGERPAGERSPTLCTRSSGSPSRPPPSTYGSCVGWGLVAVRAEGTRRVYNVDTAGLAAVHGWLARFADAFAQPLDALEADLARGRRARRLAGRAGLAREPGRATRRTAPGAAGELGKRASS
jgi:hypothetical protein